MGVSNTVSKFFHPIEFFKPHLAGLFLCYSGFLILLVTTFCARPKILARLAKNPELDSKRLVNIMVILESPHLYYRNVIVPLGQ